MNKARVTPKDFFLWAGAMIALYWSVIAFIFLLFNYIDYVFPGSLAAIPEDPYLSGVGHEMASVIVLFPIYIILMWLIRRDIKRDHTRKEIWVRRWALILTLFVTGVTIAVDLIEILTQFFNGDTLTEAFLLKALLVFLVAAAAFMHFIADLWGYWDEYPMRKRSVFIGVAALAVLSILAGFFIVGTPMQARAYQYDEQKVSDLQTIQSDVVSYWQTHNVLPTDLTQVNDAVAGMSIPVDEQTGQAYQYKVLAKLTFQLCATFNAETAPYDITPDELNPTNPVTPGNYDDLGGSWYHESGNYCFTRTIDPADFPSPATR